MTFVQNKKNGKPDYLEIQWRVGEYNRLSKEDGDKPESDSIQNQHSINQKHGLRQFHPVRGRSGALRWHGSYRPERPETPESGR